MHGSDNMIELRELNERVSAGKHTLNILKMARDLISNEAGKALIDEKISAAEKTLNLCSARIAKLTKKKS